jgi:hypothetical protein
MAKKAKKGPKDLYDKVKDIDPYFAEEAYSATDEKLNEKMAGFSKTLTEIEEARDMDESLKQLREQLKVAGQTYSEPIKGIKLKRKLVYKILKERGKVP